MENKKLVNISTSVNNKDCVTKEYLGQIPGVSLTRSIKAAKGLFVEGERIMGLHEPISYADASTKSYTGRKDQEVKTYVDGKDTAMKTYVDQGDRYRYNSTINEFEFKSEDFSYPVNIGVFKFGEYRDFTKRYHNAKSHALLSLTRRPTSLMVRLKNLKSGSYGLRIKSIINQADDNTVFDININTVNTSFIISKTKYKDQIDPYAIALDIEIQLKANANELYFTITLSNHINKEKALFLFGRRGAGHVD